LQLFYLHEIIKIYIIKSHSGKLKFDYHPLHFINKKPYIFDNSYNIVAQTKKGNAFGI